MQRKASYISSKKGGAGFIREIADLILISKGFNPYKEYKPEMNSPTKKT